jgi:hypothetical protein
MTTCDDISVDLVLGEEMSYTWNDVTGTEDFDEVYFVTPQDLLDLTEDLDDETRANIQNLDIVQIDVQLLGNTANTASSVTLSVYIKWNDVEWDDAAADINTLFSEYEADVTVSEDNFISVVDELDATTIGRLRDKLFGAVQLTDLEGFEVMAVGTIDDGELDADITVKVIIDIVTRESTGGS